MEVRVSLLYPNGRTHEETIERDTPLERGEEFELYGRRWRAITRTSARRSRFSGDEEAPILCRSN